MAGSHYRSLASANNQFVKVEEKSAAPIRENEYRVSRSVKASRRRTRELK
jgi:hypothetical protein